MSDLEKALLIAVQAHAGQKDKAGESYILHPLRVMLRMHGETDMVVAILHDVVEDSSEWSLVRLREEGFTEAVLEALDCLTRRQEETYQAFIKRAASNSIARRVKLADLEDNMNIERLQELGPKEIERLGRYHSAWRSLKAEHGFSKEQTQS